MFIHWDHASQQGLEISWPLVGGLPLLPHGQVVTVEQYHSSASTFNPGSWDPQGLARLATNAGMRYAVFTSKHHSGYSMFHTAYSEFSVEHSPYKRDIVREFVEAFRDEGLRIGLYYSLSDWHHPDYPAITEADKPYIPGASPPFPGEDRWGRYLDYMFGQIRELLTNYGPIDLVWFDGWWERPPDQWKGDDLAQLIRSLQPDILINDRLPGRGDFATPEQFLPPQPPGGPWEVCMTMNESWGFNPDDADYKSARTLIHTLCEVSGRGGNLLLNVSPMGDGSLPPEQVRRLETIGDWIGSHGESIHGTKPGLEPWQFYGPSTAKGGHLYLFLLARPYETVTVRGIPIKRIQGVRVLGANSALDFTTRSALIDRMNDDPLGETTVSIPEALLNDNATVLDVTIGAR
jgi:alpha-L-fucosidase